MSDSLWEGTCTVLAHTTKAVKVDYEHADEPQWVPNSQIHDDSEVYNKTEVGETGNLIIPYWLAKAKGWTD
jgi:hypothetical protein